jgi:hypothetical protein
MRNIIRTIYWNNGFLDEQDLNKVVETCTGEFVTSCDLFMALCNYWDSVKKDYISQKVIGMYYKNHGHVLKMKRVNGKVCRCIYGLRLLNRASIEACKYD